MKPEGAPKNGQLKTTTNIGYTWHRTKKTKGKHTTQNTKMMSYPNPRKNPGVTPGTRDE
jgi:hypothetical protein